MVEGKEAGRVAEADMKGDGIDDEQEQSRNTRFDFHMKCRFQHS